MTGVGLADDVARVIKERTDIVDLIGEYVNLARAGRMYRGLCPFHDDHRPSFQVDPIRQSWVCWPCNLRGDVYSFIMKRERLEFREAMEFLAKRVNIEIEKTTSTGPDKFDMLELIGWAVEKYRAALFYPAYRKALDYISEERQVSPETIEHYHLGYAPNAWDWLSNHALKEGKSFTLLQTLGLCGLRKDGSQYDRFRDRIIFPIRDVQGRVVALGGRLLPGSTSTEDAPKYYNSSDSPLFKKSQHLYGIDVARSAAERTGYLAVVEGYTDVLMAHQHGVLNVVATLGTALNENHLAQLKRYVSRVVLLFDADAGGIGGVERALSLFVQHEMELAIAALPTGMDPCDFLLDQGPKPFREILEKAQDALEFTLTQAFTSGGTGVEGQRQAVEKVLDVLAKLPWEARETLAVKRELILTRLAQRSGVNEKILRQELVKRQRQQNGATSSPPSALPLPQRPDRPEDKLEKELIQVLLVEPKLIHEAQKNIPLEMMTHEKRRVVLQTIYRAAEQGVATIDTIRQRLTDDPELVERISTLHAEGREKADPHIWFDEVLAGFLRIHRDREIDRIKAELRQWDRPEPPAELLQQLQEWERKAKQARHPDRGTRTDD